MSPYRHRLRTQALAAALLFAVSTAAPARTRPAARVVAPSAHAVAHATRPPAPRAGARPVTHAPKPAADRHGARTAARPHAAPAPAHARPLRTAARRGRASDGTGHATVYSRRLSGRPTASGERFDPEAMTAAHRTLPLGTAVRVTRLDTGHSIVVTINDRGVGRRGRIIDLSPAAARRLGFRTGAARVSVEPLGRG